MTETYLSAAELELIGKMKDSKIGSFQVPHEFMGNKNFVSEVLKLSDDAIMWFDRLHRGDYYIALEAVRHRGWAIEHIHEDFKTDWKICFTALVQTLKNGGIYSCPDVDLPFITVADVARCTVCEQYKEEELKMELLRGIHDLCEKMLYLSTGANDDSIFYLLSFMWVHVRDCSLMDLLVTQEQGIYLDIPPRSY